MKLSRSRVFVAVLFSLSLAVAASAQSVDAFFGLNALTARTAISSIPKLGGGLYPSVGGDLILVHGLGVSGEVAWRGTDGNYFGQPVRPLFYDFNVLYEPHLIQNPAIRPEFEVGLGAQSLRFYQGFYNCGTFTGCTDYAASNHFDLHVAAMVKVMVTDHIFLRPEIHYYNIRHDAEYQVPYAWRFGLSLGYSIGPGY